MTRILIVPAMILILFAQEARSSDIAIIKDGIGIRKSVKSWKEQRDENVMKQKYDFSCGTSSLATILKYFFNENVTEKEILDFLLEERGLEGKRKLKKEDFALSFQDLKEYADKIGYKAVGLALTLESLGELQVPAVVYLEIRQYQHFSVYRGMSDRFVYLADPSFGNMKIRIDKFKEEFYTREDSPYPGKVLVLIPRDEEKKKSVNKDFMAAGEESELVYRVIRDRAAAVDDGGP